MPDVSMPQATTREERSNNCMQRPALRAAADADRYAANAATSSTTEATKPNPLYVQSSRFAWRFLERKQI